jgi:hypothetical protein
VSISVARESALKVRRVPWRGVPPEDLKVGPRGHPSGRQPEEDEQGIRQAKRQQEPAQPLGHPHFQWKPPDSKVRLEVAEALLDLHPLPIHRHDLGPGSSGPKSTGERASTPRTRSTRRRRQPRLRRELEDLRLLPQEWRSAEEHDRADARASRHRMREARRPRGSRS